MRLSDPWEPAPRGQIQPLGAGSQGSDSTLGSWLPGVRFNPWEPALGVSQVRRTFLVGSADLPELRVSDWITS